ncbi:MAG: transcriptional repressor [Prevotellaceae bacterium]|nr:transcriptional repressor [Prevotellaceae bacterium]
MDKQSFKKAREILDSYLSTGNHRKTAERYYLLELIYSFSAMCSIYDIQQALERDRFIVSRATLYNTLRLFINLHLIIRHQMEGEVKYEAAIGRKNHCCQVCTSCGKITELHIRSIPALLNNIPTKRFRNETFSITVYGICSSCIAKSTRQKKEQEKKLKNKVK